MGLLWHLWDSPWLGAPVLVGYAIPAGFTLRRSSPSAWDRAGWGSVVPPSWGAAWDSAGFTLKAGSWLVPTSSQCCRHCCNSLLRAPHTSSFCACFPASFSALLLPHLPSFSMFPFLTRTGRLWGWACHSLTGGQHFWEQVWEAVYPGSCLTLGGFRWCQQSFGVDGPLCWDRPYPWVSLLNVSLLPCHLLGWQVAAHWELSCSHISLVKESLGWVLESPWKWTLCVCVCVFT